MESNNYIFFVIVSTSQGFISLLGVAIPVCVQTLFPRFLKNFGIFDPIIKFKSISEEST
jgi:hypothetical protein